MDALARQRLVIAHGADRTRLYALNPSHPFVDALVALFEKEQGRWDALFESIRKVLASHGGAVSAAWLYGSVARGEDVPGSDLDIAILVRSHALADRVREQLMPLEEEQELQSRWRHSRPKSSLRCLRMIHGGPMWCVTEECSRATGPSRCVVDLPVGLLRDEGPT